VDSLTSTALAGLSHSASIGYSVDTLIFIDTEMSLTVTIDLGNLPALTRHSR
jgi:hypothetical protein